MKYRINKRKEGEFGEWDGEVGEWMCAAALLFSVIFNNIPLAITGIILFLISEEIEAVK